jgi:hypothetical protein
VSKLDNIPDSYGLYTSAGEWDDAKSDIRALMLELVGEYETKGRKPQGMAEDWKARGRDKLRRELRRGLEAL